MSDLLFIIYIKSMQIQIKCKNYSEIVFLYNDFNTEKLVSRGYIKKNSN